MPRRYRARGGPECGHDYGKLRVRRLRALFSGRRMTAAFYPSAASFSSASRSGSARLFFSLADLSCPQAAMISRPRGVRTGAEMRSEEHTSELQSLMRISYAVFGLQ